MDFENGKYNDRVFGKLPEWRASDGKLRDKKSKNKDLRQSQNEHKDTNFNDNKSELLTGYEASEKERKEGSAPKKILDIDSSYGTFSIGSNKKKELVTVTSQKRKRNSDILYNESKTLQSESAVKWQRTHANIRTNNARRDVSAVEFKSDTTQQVPFIMEKMRKRVVEKNEFDVHEEIIPIFSLEKEMSELRELRERRKIMLRKGGDTRDKQEIENQIEYIEGIVSEKKMEKRKVLGKLSQARSQINEQAKPSDYISNFFRILQSIISDDGSEEDGDNDDVDNEDFDEIIEDIE